MNKHDQNNNLTRQARPYNQNNVLTKVVVKKKNVLTKVKARRYLERPLCKEINNSESPTNTTE
jgi:phage FluMu protein Com